MDLNPSVVSVVLPRQSRFSFTRRLSIFGVTLLLHIQEGYRYTVRIRIRFVVTITFQPFGLPTVPTGALLLVL
jgi:uncharacterized protein YqiB (DUF1249 family)